MIWTAYNITQIKFGWQNLITINDTLSVIIQERYKCIPGDINVPEIESFLINWENAKGLAREQGWDGNFNETPRVFWLPAKNKFIYGFVFTQDNNGNVFIISPEPLPWLENAKVK